MGRGFRKRLGGEAIASEDTDTFSIFGPFHLTSIDWTNPYHRTSVASSLVNGVYTLEADRLEERVGSEALAKPWWEFFHFTLLETLLDDDSSIYGAIFEYELYNVYENTPNVKVPRYVIAFRGTVLKGKTWKFDLKLDLKCIFNTLHQGGRSMYALNAVRRMVDNHNHSAIWLAGHSLGAALVLLAGKTMTRVGFLLESYIFNPPISSIPLEQLPGGDIIKGVFQIAKSVVKATVAMALTDLQVPQDDPKTASWIPYLYVNPADPICAGYIDYFRHKTFMSEIGASHIERTGARKSVRSLLVGRKGKTLSSDLSSEPLHLLPSADMTVNKNKPTKSTTAHGLHQWWERDSTLRANWESCCIRPYPEGKLEQLTLQ
ncbi:Fungal lipase-like domain [Arabidopsis thaliana x Arabidopsis arenosa]|uniref:Fungal lipase-like domain n=1 Tax=Arabidopsis thaliana x Arabidopsis arenosa TaxID=1240361 RepID=A0A8T1Z0K9_9BRAS|nr:Fungal lipase-like domain [Arabidopsis thaliana x Arabidopsis arenosa]